MSYRMTLILFTVFAGKMCSAVSPLPQDIYANFSRDPLTDDATYDSFMRSVFFLNEITMRQVLHRNGSSCGLYMTALPEEPWYVMNLKLNHRQMHYKQSSFFTDLKGKTMTKRIENMLPGHEKRDLLNKIKFRWG